MYNNRQIGADNGGKVPLASNQVDAGSIPAGWANYQVLTTLLKIALSSKSTILQ
jgi:hypothetical protein